MFNIMRGRQVIDLLHGPSVLGLLTGCRIEFKWRTVLKDVGRGKWFLSHHFLDVEQYFSNGHDALEGLTRGWSKPPILRTSEVLKVGQ